MTYAKTYAHNFQVPPLRILHGLYMTVTIKVKVDEKNPSSSMRVYFYPKVSGASGLSTYLYLNKNTMEYTGGINISQNTRPAKWELTSLSLSDTNGNSTSLSDFRPDWDTARPWYFNVDPEGYLNDTNHH